MTSEISKDGKAARAFISDIEPFFFGRPITYVDAGAHNGSVFRQLLTSGFYVREAHLIEPNPRTFDALRAAVADVHKVNHVACHELALSSSTGSVTMRDEDSMTHVVSGPSHDPADAGMFQVETTTLDDLVQQNQIGHINLLKIDVEGHELHVLEGAGKTLAAEAVDVIYVEAGMNPDSEQHVHYRAIEEALQPYGYRILRFYEQRNEWLEDSPLLRRTNIAFASSSFAEHHPYKLSRELVRLRKRNDELSRTNSELDQRNDELSRKISGLEQRNDELSRTGDELQKRTDDLNAHVARLQEQVSAIPSLERERDKAAAEAAATAEQLAAVQHKAGAVEQRLTHQQAELVKYADELEKRYLGVLRSTTWRVMAPVRAAGRTLRRLRGRPASRNRLPKRPTVDGDIQSPAPGKRRRRPS